jgi:hypothetical protein
MMVFLIHCYGLATKTGGANGEAAGGSNCVACSLLIDTFVSVAGLAAVHRCAWLDTYTAMRLFQSLDTSPFTSREYSHQRISRGQTVNLNYISIKCKLRLFKR